MNDATGGSIRAAADATPSTIGLKRFPLCVKLRDDDD
jgi:hypothetical protein